jgi:hypothetical protein
MSCRQDQYLAGGWLGILTAGALWTPLHERESFDSGIELLVRQIFKNVIPSDEEGDDIFSIDDVRGELARMRDDESSAVSPPSAGATVPAVVPSLPVGLQVSAEMQQLLDNLLGSDTTRCGFCGMGGIGKTVVSSWLVRQTTVREAFQKIAWVTLGQTPNIDEVQESLFAQLTSAKWDSDASSDKKKMAMQNAFAQTDVCLVLDDVWEPWHESLLNFIDVETKSKVLLSSRLRGIILDGLADQQTTTIVDIKLPTEDDAIKMLLSTGGVQHQSVPAEAYELVKLCKRLPLAISIAGKLIKELEFAETDDMSSVSANSAMWADIVQVMRAEFASNKTVGETMISTSIKGLKGAQRENIVQLFKSLALLPEDTACPLDIMALVFEASCASTSASVPAKRPMIISIRRWLKMLIDRSLVLGTVDNPSLHDVSQAFPAVILCSVTLPSLLAMIPDESYRAGCVPKLETPEQIVRDCKPAFLSTPSCKIPLWLLV